MMDPFDGELVTPTMKIKRNLVAKVYKKDIDDLYNEHDSTQAKL